MKLRQITVRHLQMQLLAPFTTSFGTLQTKDFLLLEAVDEDGISGFGESVAFHVPWYNEETLQTNWHMLEDFLIPLAFEAPIAHPDELSRRFAFIRKNYMAKSALEGAIWDLYSKKTTCHSPVHWVARKNRSKSAFRSAFKKVSPICSMSSSGRSRTGTAASK